MMGSKELTELVLEAGVDVNLKDNKGKIPLQLAREKGHTEIVELLRKHEAEELLPPPHERQSPYLPSSKNLEVKFFFFRLKHL